MSRTFGLRPAASCFSQSVVGGARTRESWAIPKTEMTPTPHHQGNRGKAYIKDPPRTQTQHQSTQILLRINGGLRVCPSSRLREVTKHFATEVVSFSDRFIRCDSVLCKLCSWWNLVRSANACCECGVIDCTLY
jgi:hypothetical protein